MSDGGAGDAWSSMRCSSAVDDYSTASISGCVHAALDSPRVEQDSGMTLQVTENRNASEEQEKAKSNPSVGMGTCKDALRGGPVVNAYNCNTPASWLG
jgi:hypothetical protein